MCTCQCSKHFNWRKFIKLVRITSSIFSRTYRPLTHNLETFKLISKFVMWIPCLVAFSIYHKLNRVLRMLPMLLLWGFVVDMKRYMPDIFLLRRGLMAVYPLTEIIFFIWFIQNLSNFDIIRKWNKLLYLIVISLWAFSYWTFIKPSEALPQNAIFDVVSSFLVILLSAFSLLELTKHETPLPKQSAFWFFLFHAKLFYIFIYFREFPRWVLAHTQHFWYRENDPFHHRLLGGCKAHIENKRVKYVGVGDMCRRDGNSFKEIQTDIANTCRGFK